MVWIAGQTASDKNNTVIGTTLDEQVDVAADNVKKALEAVGASVDNLVHVQYFIAQYDPDTDFPAVLKAGRSLASSRGGSPAAELIGVQSLGLREYRIEISGVAVLP
ncbi:unnamed protein product [Ostreobium quekettii]|uniref:RidA family protein n=1 Tax=Ostreobium quekettii TaxID=121088 RepID=A0A8S1IMR0_9CHLO|nr:unnamed protein product [Ostreobium quekettii]